MSVSTNAILSAQALPAWQKITNKTKERWYQKGTRSFKCKGWIQKKELYTIIGETDLWFIYRLQESGHGEWVGNKVIQHKYILPIGIHKSRLVRWMDYQLSLF